MSQAPATSLDSPITIKIAIDGTNRKFKLPLRDLGLAGFNNRIRHLLQVPSNQTLVLERFSDSSGSFVTLDPSNPSSYKQLYRAAKAKLKLKLRATLVPNLPFDQESRRSKLERILTYTSAFKNVDLQGEAKSVQDKPTLPPLAQLLGPNYTSNTTRSSAQPQTAQPMSGSTDEAPKRPANPHLNASCWQVCCNKCDKQVTNAHFHCSICDGGDYDLCESCVSTGAICPGEDHWLIKRVVQDGGFVSSTTETIAPKAKKPESAGWPMPGAFNTDAKSAASSSPKERICNVCIRSLPEDTLVTCEACPDYDICVPCLMDDKHGHHPAHLFKPIGKLGLTSQQRTLCQPGRNTRHHAICDNCDQTITGVRYKCLDCPDFDFCSTCHSSKRSSHCHRFVPVYETLPLAPTFKVRHSGIYCDGPLCTGKQNQSYIQGTRYKCAVCHDIDFCAGCEAHPSNDHNRTHPLIKFTTMVRDVSVETLSSRPDGIVHSLGDRRQSIVPQNTSARSLPPYTAQASSADAPPRYSAEKATQRPASSQVYSFKPLAPPPSQPLSGAVSASELTAEFIRDTVSDGTLMESIKVFQQTWTLRNSGPYPWPTGCSVRHIGGDHMLNVDQSRPGSVAELAKAQETNVTGAPVLPGQSYHFSVTLKAPTKLGKHISYWRLKSPDGTPFGHKLWCDIQVVAPPPLPSEVPRNAPQPFSWQFPPARPNPQGGALADYQQQQMKLDAMNKLHSLKAREVCNMLAQGQTHLLSPPAPPPKVNEKATTTEEPMKQESEPKASSDELKKPDSGMVFPKLEKESPASSTHQDEMNPPPSATLVTSPSTAPAATETDSNEDETKDVQSVASFSDSEDEDDGFLTDEEYDILDASDEEVINAPAP